MRNYFARTIGILFPIILAFKLAERILTGYYKESWQITEWLINYQGGFVRRGLIGELLLISYYRFGLSPYYVILSACFCLYVALVVFFYRSFRRAGLPLFLLPFVFLLGAPVLNNFWARKDLLLIWLFIGMVRLTVIDIRGKAIGINLLLVFALLVHESVGFWAVPVLLLLNYQQRVLREVGRPVKAAFISALQLSPGLAAFLLVLYNKGTVGIASAIWESWKPVPFPFQDQNATTAIPSAIDGISWSLQKGVSFSAKQLANFNDGIYAPIAWLIIIVSIFIVSVNIHRLGASDNQPRHVVAEERSSLCSFLLLQLLAVSPLFILGFDYGRWIFFWVTTSFILYLLVPPPAAQVLLLPRRFIPNRVVASADALAGRSRGELLLLAMFIGMPNSIWNMENYYRSTPLYLLLEFSSKAVRYVHYYLGLS
ncbi:hypothetical protein [Geomonas oryzae]|uniref:hypothetical protein n=1 Tax=Geomonas oryzae TaxID=2364273 RepID=UPI00100ACF80|nr:hypothetical protein [Geomonas oryzae]